MEIKKAKPATRSPAEARLVDLATEIGGAFVQITAEGIELRSSRIRPTDDVIDFLRRLVDEHGHDVVRGYALDYAEVCRGNGLEAQRWRPNMLCDQRRGDRTKSAWEMLVIRVDEWRVARDAKIKQQRDAEARVARDKAFAESCAPCPSADTLTPDQLALRVGAWLSRDLTDQQLENVGLRGHRAPSSDAVQIGLPGVISRVAARVTRQQGLPPRRDEPAERSADDEEGLRRQGRWREHQQLRAETDDLEVRRARNRRMVEALQLAEVRGTPLTADEIAVLRGGVATG